MSFIDASGKTVFVLCTLSTCRAQRSWGSSRMVSYQFDRRLAEPGGGSGRRDHAPTRLISVNGPNPSIERTSSGKLRFPAAPAHVER